ncbi:hypothetical protein Tco_0294121, partial [Tanacetum coccineum]
VPSDDEAPIEDQPLPADASPVALLLGYEVDSDPEEDLEEDPEEDHADYPADGGDDYYEPSDDDDNDDDMDDEDEEPFKDDKEEEHLALADSPAIPVIDLVPSAEDTEVFKTDEATPTHVPSPRRHMARMSVRPQTPVPFPSEVEVERLLALPILPPSPLSSPLHQIPSPPLPPPPSSQHLPLPVPTSLPLPLSPLPPLPASLFIPPVDCREDTSEDELPPRKRLCLTALTSRYEVGESLTAAPRPTRDSREAAEEVAPTTLEGVNTRVTKLAAVQDQDTLDIYAVIKDTQDCQTRIFQSVEALFDDRQYHYETARLLDQEALVSREAWAHSVGLSLAVHYELQGYKTHTWMQNHRIDAQESLIAMLVAQVSSLQGHLVTALGEIRALQARDQTRADAPEGAGSSA